MDLSYKRSLVAAMALLGLSSIHAFVVTNSARNFGLGLRSDSILSAATTIDTLSSIPSYEPDYSEQSRSREGSVQDVKVGVLLLNLGGPEKTEDVEGMLGFCWVSFECN